MPGLSEHFHPPEPQLVVLGRKGVLIHADLTYRFLRRQVARGKTVDQNFIRARPRGRPGECRQIRLQVFRIVGQRIQIVALDHRCAGIGARVEYSPPVGAPAVVYRDRLRRRRNRAVADPDVLRTGVKLDLDRLRQKQLPAPRKPSRCSGPVQARLSTMSRWRPMSRFARRRNRGCGPPLSPPE